jgi:hypothetical protein
MYFPLPITPSIQLNLTSFFAGLFLDSRVRLHYFTSSPLPSYLILTFVCYSLFGLIVGLLMSGKASEFS